MASSRRFLVLLACVYSAVAVPVTRRESCSRHCTESSRFEFSPGTTYTYDYETMTTTNLKGTSEEQSQLQMKAQVDIEVLSKCELSLRLRSVSLKQSDPQNPDYLMPIKGGRDFAKSAQKYFLRFSYQDGIVEDLCPHEDAPAWLTNIQRGVLSAFQNSMSNLEGNERITETDVGGKCTVDYQSLGRSWRGTLTIRKVKDLNTCSDRQSIQTAFQGAPFTQGSSIQSAPLVRGHQECEQVIGSGIVQSTTCSETHSLRPFTKGSGGATTTVNQRLTFVTTTQQRFTGSDYRPTRANLLFDHGEIGLSSNEHDEEAERSLAKVCEASSRDMSIEVPSLFASFVYRLKKLDFDALKNMYKKVDTICPNNPKAKKFFLDAIPAVSTEGSVKFMAHVISRREVDTAEINFWFTSMSFLSEPTLEMITTLTPLLDGNYDQAMFGISSLIHTFCQNNDCTDNRDVQFVVHKLAGFLGEHCFNPDSKMILMTLKALGNIGLPFGRERIMERCAMSPQLETEVRIAAIQTFRRFPCDISRDTFLKMYSNYNEGSEMRIAAYLEAINCPNEETVNIVKHTLENEQVNQVGSFVWTHLRAVAKSNHPNKQQVRDILANLYLLNKYESDIRKFSSAREASIFLDSIGTGLHLDTHMIYPTHSYLPHSAMFNLSVDIFGHDCNLLQLDGRMEGMEYLLEKYFGPSGLLPQKQVSSLLRNKRSISDNKIDRMDREFDVKSNFGKKPFGSLDVKIFGNTLWYNQFKEDDQGESFNLMDFLNDLAKERETEFSRSFMFLDTSYSIPMASGLPLRLALNGTATVGLKMGGKFNVRSFENIDIIAKLEPSGSVELAGLLTVDAGGVTRTGLRIAATVHSSTALDSKVEVQNGQVVRAHMYMPRDKIEIIDVQSKLFLVYGSDEREQTGHKDNRFVFETCTGKAARRVFGVVLCSELSLPKGQRGAPMYPMNGAASFRVFLLKTDPTLKSYTFDASWDDSVINGKTVRNAVISLNTPQTATDREVSLQFQLNELDHYFMLDLKSPVKKISVKAKYANTKDLRKLDVSATVDKTDTYSIRSELRGNNENGGISYFPTLEITIPSRTVLSITGSAHIRHGMKYGGQITVTDLTVKPIVLKGNLEMKNKNRYDGEISLSSFALDTSTTASIQTSDMMSLQINTNYRIMESKEYKVTVSGKVRNQSLNSLKKFNGILNMQATAFPEWDTQISFETMASTGHIENTMSLTLGDGVRSRAHTINFQEILHYKGDWSNNNGELTLKFSYPDKRLNYGFEMKHENTMTSLKNNMAVQYAKNRQISTAVTVKLEQEELIQFTSDIQLKYPGRSTKLWTNLRESSPRNYRSEFGVQWQEGKKITVISHYRNKGDENTMKHEADAEIAFSFRQPIKLSSAIAASAGHYTGFAEANLGLEKYKLYGDYKKGFGVNHRFLGQLDIGAESYETNLLLQHVREKLSGNVEVKLPSRRRVYAKLDMKDTEGLKTVTIDSMWDADRDNSQRFGFDGELRTKDTGYDSKFSMQVIQRTFRGFLSTARDGGWYNNYLRSVHRGEFEWSPKGKVTLVLNTNMLKDRSRSHLSTSVDIGTSFKGFEAITASVKHGTENQQWSSEVSASWGNNKRIVINSDGMYSFTDRNTVMETALKFRSPFKNFESLSFNGSHFHSPIEFSNKMQIQWYKDKVITTDIYHDVLNSGFKCGLKVTTPFAPYNDMSTEIAHTYSSGGYKTNAMAQWAPTKKINWTVDMKHMFTGRRRTGAVNVMVTSPFRGYEALTGKFVYNNDGVTVNTDVEVHRNQNKLLTSGFTGSLQNNYYNKNAEGKFHLTSTFEHFENVQVSTLFQLSTDSYKFNIDAQTPYDSGLSVNSEGKLVSWRDIELNALISGKLPGFQPMQPFSVDFSYKLHNSNLRSTFDVKYGRKQTIVLLTGVSKPGYKTRDLEGSLSIRTPFNGYEEMKLDATHKVREWEFMTRVEGSKNRENILLLHNMNIKDLLNLESSTHITSTIQELRDVKIAFTQVYNPGYFAHNTKVQWHRNKIIAFNAQYQRKMSSRELTINLNTPFDSCKSCVVTAEHQSSHTEFKTKVRVLLNEQSKLFTECSVINYRMQKGDLDIQVVSNIDRYRSYKLNGKFDITSMQKTANLNYLWNDKGTENIISLMSDITINKQTPKLNINLITPFDEYEKVTLIANGENRKDKKLVSISYERDWRKIAAMAKYQVSKGSTQFETTFTSPYKIAENLRFLAKSQMENGEFTGYMETQWAENRKIIVSSEALRSDTRVEGKLSVKTPFNEYKEMSVDGVADVSTKTNTANMAVRWGEGKVIALSADCEVKPRREGKFKAEFSSPFKGFRKITAYSQFRSKHNEFDMSNQVLLEDGKMYRSHMNYNWDGVFVARLNTPHRPIRDVKLNIVLKNEEKHQGINSRLSWDDKEMSFATSYKNDGRDMVECSLNLNIPLGTRGDMKIDGSFINNYMKSMDSRLMVSTPFESIQSFEVSSNLKFKPEIENVIKVITPTKTLTVTAKATNSFTSPVKASLSIDAPFASFKNLQLIASSDLKTEAEISLRLPKVTHSITTKFNQDGTTYNVEINAMSPLLKTGNSKFISKIDLNWNKNIQVDVNAEILGQRHSFNGLYRKERNEQEIEATINSPVLPKDKAEVKISHTYRRQRRTVDAKWVFSGSTHQLRSTYEGDSSQISANIILESNLLPMSMLKSSVKYENGNNRDLEMIFSVETPKSKHEATASIKNYDGEKFFQVKVDCPLLAPKPYSVTGTLKHEGYEAIDGVLTFTSPKSDELRIAANMKSNGLASIEGFLAINTPFKCLRMLRIDSMFKNDRFRNVETMLKMESSNRNYPSYSVSAKISRAQGSEDLSLMLRLPNTNYHTIKLLGNMHYNRQMTTADGRFTLSFPSNVYSAYGQYTLEQNYLAVNGELELDNKKWTAESLFQNIETSKGVTLVLRTPNSNTVEAAGMLQTDNNRQSLLLRYSDQRQQVYRMNLTVGFYTPSKFDVILDASTPFAKYHSVDCRVFFENQMEVFNVQAESSINSQKAFFTVNHRVGRSNYYTKVRAGSPYRTFKEMEVSHVLKKNGVERIIEVSYNRQKKVVLEITVAKDTLAQAYVLDLPIISLNLKAQMKPREYGKEITVTSNYPTRKMSFYTVYENRPGHFVHEASIVWDKENQKYISYNTKLADISAHNAVGKEFFARMNFPLRSMELKGKFSKSGRVQSGGAAFYWDVTRDTRKNMTIGIEHHDLSKRDMTSHKLQMTLTHPSLSKDLVQTNVLVISPTEFRTKSELEYSHDREHDLVVEVNANDVSRNGDDSHYKTEVTLRHLVSHLDFKMMGEITNNNEESTAHLKINKGDKTGQHTVREIKAKILKLRKQIDVLVKSGENQMTLFGKMSKSGHDVNMQLDQKINNRQILQSTMRFNNNLRTMDMSMTMPENKNIQLSASFPDDSVSIKLSHTGDETSVTDGFVFIGLENSRIFKSRVSWRPGMWRDFRIATGETLRGVSASVRQGSSELSTELQNDWGNKLSTLGEILLNHMVPFVKEVQKDIAILTDDIQAARKTLNLMFENNEFYIRNIMYSLNRAYGTFRSFCEAASEILDLMTNIMLEYCEELYDSMYYAIEDFFNCVKGCYQKIKIQVNEYTLKTMKWMTVQCKKFSKVAVRQLGKAADVARRYGEIMVTRAEVFVRHYAPYIIDMYYSAKITADKIRTNAQRMTNAVSDTVTKHPVYVALCEYRDQAVATIQAFEVSDLTSSIQSRVIFFGEQAGNFMNQLSDVQLLDIIRNRIPVDYMTDMAKHTLKKGFDLYQVLGMDNVMNSLVGYGVDHIKEVALSSGNELLQEFYQLKSGAKYNFDPKHGLFSFEYTLPSSSNSIYDVFNFGKYTEYKKLVEIKNTLVDKYYEDFCIWDLYYTIKNAFCPKQWVPPFRAHGMLAGNQHFVTFDKFAFDFAGECSYLLARDFVDGNFTVVANYKRDGQRVSKKSLTIMSQSTKVDVVHDYKVSVNDVKVELPVKVEDVTIVREGSTIRIENELKGLTVICNFVHDVCTIGMSGFYFGKTGGLLGTYDHEPRLDFMTPERNLAKDVESFANSWEVGQSTCRRTANMATVPGNDYRVEEQCKTLFTKTSSNFRACFKQVNPEPYLRMCVSDLSAVDPSELDSAICVSAAAYFTECKIEGVELKMPKSCVRCETENDTPMYEGDMMKIRPDQTSRSADVVFIVEEKECNNKNYKFLEKLAYSIEDNFRAQDFLDVRYRVVGFGGDNVHAEPHIHTIDGQDYGGVRSLASAFDSLQVGNGPSNTLEALRFAASLNYHPGSIKSFILVKCSACMAEENKVAYGEVLRSLMDAEITLHVLMEYKYDMKNAKNNKAKKVIGLDKNFAYTLKDTKDTNLFGDGDLLVQVKMPKDVCVPLALEVNGSSFDSQYLSDMKKNTYKKFMDVVSRRMLLSAKQRSGMTVCCECIATSDGVGKTTCQKCVSSQVVNMISADTFISPYTKSKVRKPRHKKASH